MSLLNATHSFLPWARRGLASEIQETEIFDGTNPLATGTVDERATIVANVHIKVNNNQTPAGGVSPVPVNFQIIGPGDVIGIHKDAVVKTEPHNWITNFEPHSFPFIDFYEEDFPWRYTPAKATANGKKLRPWLTLIVLKEDEFTRSTIDGAPLNAIVLDATKPANERPLPKNDELWAWAHVSIDETLGTASSSLPDRITDLNTKVNAKPSVAISRIICPRKLEENTSYTAFLIPTYETGRLAGLGIAIAPGTKAQAPAWDHSAAWPGTNSGGTFPVYHEWYFRTGATGDFEYLVRQVKPRIADLRVGKRPMDIQSPGYGLFYTATQATSQPGAEWLEGALVVPLNNAPLFFPAVPTQNQPSRTPEEKFSDNIKDFVNLGEDILTYPANNPMLSQAFPAPGDPNPASDPVIAPPLYARWHALRSKADRYNNPNLWLNELNLDPRYRVAASLGGDYIRKNQELLMDEAWDQVGDVLEANRKAALAQLALATSQAMHARHIASQPIEQLLPMTSSVHAKIKTGTITLQQNMNNSSLPESATSSTFRKISRPTGVLVKRLDPSMNQPANNPVGKMIQGSLAPAAAKQSPGAMAATFQMNSLNTAISNVQAVANPAAVPYNISLPAGPVPAPNATVSTNFYNSFTPFTGVFDAVNWQPSSGQPNLTTTANIVSDGINPAVTHVNNFYKGLTSNNIPFVPPTPGAIVPVMAAPLFVLPMYESVKDLGTDFLIPNLNLIPQNSITILESNQKFIEAFLAGANYEMGRELLWREYPTDQRGTYFKHFWNSVDNPGANMANTPDIKPIHQWLSNTALGTHSDRTGTGSNNLVLAIRGDFLKKFPNAVIFAVEADWGGNTGSYWNLPRVTKLNAQGEENKKYPIFSAKIDPDITFLGFDITAATAKGNRSFGGSPGWFFVIMERPGELRFGLDKEDSGTQQNLTSWNTLTWSPLHVAKNTAGYLLLTQTPQFQAPLPLGAKQFPPDNINVDWAEDSTAMAQILYQNPVKVLIHANEMIP